MSPRTGVARFSGLLSDVYLKLAYVAINWPAVFGRYRRITDVAYGEQPQHRLDVYIPDKPVERTPLIVCWHGGRWSDGDKADFRFVGAGLAELGYITVVPNFRHHPQVKMPDILQDAARACLWAAAHAQEWRADPNRMYLLGHSAGAHIAALVTLDERYYAALGQAAPRIAGVIGLSGPYDFLPFREADLEEIFGPPERYPESQPINFVRPEAPPMLLVHGLSDMLVPPHNSINLAAALNSCGARAILKLYPGLKHAETVAALSVPARKYAPTLADIAVFVNQT